MSIGELAQAIKMTDTKEQAHRGAADSRALVGQFKEDALALEIPERDVSKYVQDCLRDYRVQERQARVEKEFKERELASKLEWEERMRSKCTQKGENCNVHFVELCKISLLGKMFIQSS